MLDEQPHPAFRGAKGYPLPRQAGKGNQKKNKNKHLIFLPSPLVGEGPGVG